MSAEAGSDLYFATISDLGDGLASGDVSPVELVQAMLDRIERHNDESRAFITVARDLALDQARLAEQEIRSGKYRGPLHGIPIALKDNIATKGVRTSGASMVDPNWIPDADAAAYRRLRDAGAVLLGKTNLDEFGFSSNPAYPPPRNPWRADRTAGGSSSGSAVAVASGMAYGALGTDTGGSGRYPAHVNGIVGFQATFGRVSRRGVIPMSYSLDNVTVLARSVTDSAILMQAIAGYDPQDEHSSRVPVTDLREQLGHGVSGLRIGYARGHTFEDIDADVVDVTQAALAVLRDLGAEIEEVRLPFVEHCTGLYRAISLPEVAAVHYRHLRDASDGFGEVGVLRLALGNVIPAVDYIHAQQLRKQMRDEFRNLFEEFDVLVGPARARRAGQHEVPKAAGWVTHLEDGREIDLWSEAPEYSGIYNLVGIPAIVVPAGFSSEKTPIGIQFAGRWFDEARLLRAAHAFEQATDWHLARPPYPLPTD